MTVCKKIIINLLKLYKTFIKINILFALNIHEKFLKKIMHIRFIFNYS
jgi:hypothetical protein